MTLVARSEIDMLAPDHAEALFLVRGSVHGRAVAATVASPADVLDEMMRWYAEDPEATGHWQLRSDYSSAITVTVRRKPGRIRESRRVAHLVYLVPGAPQGYTLSGHCGDTLPITDIEWLSIGAGMPCEDCMRMASRAGARQGIRAGFRDHGSVPWPAAPEL